MKVLHLSLPKTNERQKRAAKLVKAEIEAYKPILTTEEALKDGARQNSSVRKYNIHKKAYKR